MKHLTTFFATVALCSSLFAQSSNEEASCFSHMKVVNSFWEDHADHCPSNTVIFASESARIAMHLQLVIQTLRTEIPTYLNQKQRSQRLELLKALQAYADQQVFPVNSFHNERRPYFVDIHNTHCAVGYMMAESGSDDLVEKIRANYNYDYLANIDVPEVIDWARKSGFTLEELAWIQPTYAPTSTVDTIGNGTNGPVKKMEVDNWDGRLLFVGDFSIVDFQTCANVGVYKDGQLSCLGGGVNGLLNDIVRLQDAVYVFGALEYNGQIYPVAKYDEISWTYIGVPGREGASATTGHYAGSGNVFQVAIHPDNQLNMQELWTLSNGGVWEQNAEVDGEICVIESSGFGRVYAGKFQTVQVLNSGVVDTILSVNNVVFKENYSDLWFGVDGEISDTVKSIQAVGTALYFGGTCTFDAGGSSPCLSRYLNLSLQTVIPRTWFDESSRISMNSLLFDDNQNLYIGGEFPIQLMMGTQGTNLAKFDLINNVFEGLAMTDHQVNSLLMFNGKIYVGGEFETNLYTDTVRYIGRLDNVLKVNNMPEIPKPIVFPNPFIDLLQVEGIALNAGYSLTDVQGREIQKGNLVNGTINGLEDLPKGMYNLLLSANGEWTACKLVK